MKKVFSLERIEFIDIPLKFILLLQEVNIVISSTPILQLIYENIIRGTLKI